MKAVVNFDEEHDQYELGATIDGAFVPFVTVPGTQARGAIESAKNTETAQQSTEQD